MRSATTLGPPEDGLVLRRRDDVVDVVLRGVVLLSSAALETERAFGRLAGELALPSPHVLVGGLGFGATVRGVLDVLPEGGRVTVVEKLPAIVALTTGELSHLSDRATEDPRVSVVVDDVVSVIERSQDLACILLDVDNGPGWASFRSNARLYGDAGLLAAKRALAPGGALAVWSGYPADAFNARLRKAGLAPTIVPLLERGVVRARAYVGRRS